MSVVPRRLTTIAIILACATRLSGQAMPPVEETKLKAEVEVFMESYWALASAGNIDRLVAEIYHPFGQLGNQGASTVEELRSRFPGFRQPLVAAGYARSDMPVRNICLLAPTVAIVSGRGQRYRIDGTLLNEAGWTYTLIKGRDGWRMVSLYSHDPNVAVSCGRP